MENELFDLPQYKETCTVYCLVDKEGYYRARGNGNGYSARHRAKDLSKAKIYRTEKQANSFLEEDEQIIPIVMIRQN